MNNNIFDEDKNLNNTFMPTTSQSQLNNNLNKVSEQITSDNDFMNSQSNIQNNSNSTIEGTVVHQSDELTSINQINNNTQPQLNNINPIGNSQSSNGSILLQQTNDINSNMQNNINNLNNEYINQVTENHDEELIKSFIGKNYEKIINKKFNLAGFFFTTFYMLYRKMFLYSILLFIIMLVTVNIVDNIFIIILFSVIVGLFVNKIYFYFANKKIAKIKLQNPQKHINELKEICSSKGGTSVGQIFLGIFTQLAISFVVLIIMLIAGIGSFIGSFFNLELLNENNQNSNLTNQGTLVEDVLINGYSCINSVCYISIGDLNDYVEYLFEADNIELIKALNDYQDYVKLNIYYSQNEEEKIIINYELFLKDTNENISNIKSEDELRTKLGLYTTGTYTVPLTLTEIGGLGAGFKDNMSYTYRDYTFTNNENIEYQMEYINPDDTLNLVVGNKYNVTFEVVEGSFDYEFNIKSIQ